MVTKDKKIQAIKNIISRGIVHHGEIVARLNKAEIAQINADEVLNLVMRYKYSVKIGFKNKIIKGVLAITNKILGYISAIIGAVVLAEIMASRAFAGSLVEDKLHGFGNHLLYWLGKKSIKITGPEMMIAMTKVINATPQIIKGMIIGIALGYIIGRIVIFVFSFIYKRKKMQRDIRQLLKKCNNDFYNPTL